jgi:succinoglycan biosynthesis protein ExoL
MQSIVKHNILMLLPVRTQPRYRKRIKGLKDSGADIKACYFERHYFDGEALDCESVCLGEMKEGSYLSRIIILLKASLTLRQYKNQGIVYCFGMDMLFLCLLSGLRKHKVAYEVSDIRPDVVQDNLKGKILRAVEKLLLKIVDVVVVTAPGYINGYYNEILKVSDKQKFFVLENKLDPAAIPRDNLLLTRDTSKIHIGYFGLLRCDRSWDALKLLVEKCPDQFEVHVFGRPINPISLPVEANSLAGITYYGEFMWPADLEKMYCSVDVVWGCYPYGDSAPGNWQWAKTNRFYESCYFRKPLITLLNSADAAVVSKLNIGFSVDLSDINKTVEFLTSKLSKEYLASLTNNLGQVPEQSYLYMDDHDRLIKSIEMV